MFPDSYNAANQCYPWISYLCHCDRTPKRNNLREERFVLAHFLTMGKAQWENLSGPKQQKPVGYASHIVTDSKQRQDQKQDCYNREDSPLGNLQAMSRAPKHPTTSQYCTTEWGEGSGEFSHLNHNNAHLTGEACKV